MGSDIEEGEAQLTSLNTTKQLAEYKARVVGEHEMADKIRENNVTNNELRDFINESYSDAILSEQEKLAINEV